jgi:hypothetical protein
MCPVPPITTIRISSEYPAMGRRLHEAPQLVGRTVIKHFSPADSIAKIGLAPT